MYDAEDDGFILFPGIQYPIDPDPCPVNVDPLALEDCQLPHVGRSRGKVHGLELGKDPFALALREGLEVLFRP